MPFKAFKEDSKAFRKEHIYNINEDPDYSGYLLNVYYNSAST